jgi:hypothetical protein
MPKFLKAKIKTHLLFVIGSRGSSRLVQPGDLLHHTGDLLLKSGDLLLLLGAGDDSSLADAQPGLQIGDLLYERVYHHRRFLKAVL